MTRAHVKLCVKADDGRQRETEWFFLFNTFQTFADVAQEGCRRLGITDATAFNVYEKHPLDSTSDPSIKLLMDEIVKADKSYYIIDERLDPVGDQHTCSATSSSNTFFEPSSHRTSQLPSQHPSCSTVTAVGLPTSRYQYNYPPSQQHNSSNVSETEPSAVFCGPPPHSQNQHQAAMAADTSSPQPSSSTYDRAGLTTISRRMIIANYYTDHQLDIDHAYASYVYDPLLMIGNTNIYQFFGERPVAKTAVYIFKSSRSAGQRLRSAAVHLIEKVAKEILQTEYPTFIVQKAILQKFAVDLNTLTSTNLFFNVTMVNGQGFGDRFLRGQRKLNPTNSTPPRRSAKPAPSVDIEPLSATANAETDLGTLHQIHAESSDIILQWLTKLKTDPAYARGMVSHVLSKFRHLKRDTSLLHLHFKNFMKNDPRLSFNLADKYRSMIDRIQASAMAAESTTAALPDDPHRKEFHSGTLLALIIAKTLKSRKADYGRLVLDFTHTSNFHDAILRKNEIGITAPAIVALGTHPEMTFYICVDDDILRVRGQFADALQSYMEIVHLFNLEYDKKTVGITYFLEALMGMKHQLTSGRQRLLDTLLPPLKMTDSTATSTSNNPPPNTFPDFSNTETSTSPKVPHTDEDSFIQIFDEYSNEPTCLTPRKRPAQSLTYGGKKPRHTPSAIHQLYSPTSPYSTPTSSHHQNREPSPSIFD
uniref:Uncharacterized protein n=1 Tax=Panagrolaimus superbus TaxID=310955 RepID=A0A914YPP4_9BILA